MTKELLDEIYALVSDGSKFKFGYSPVPKGHDHFGSERISEGLRFEFYEWMTGSLAEECHHHGTDFELTIENGELQLDCLTSCGGWLYDDLHSSEELMTEEVIKLLLPTREYDSVELDKVFLHFEYETDSSTNESSFHWYNEEAIFCDDENDIEIPIAPFKLALEEMLHDILFDFEADGGSSFHDAISTHKSISVEDGSVTVEETCHHKIVLDLGEKITEPKEKVTPLKYFLPEISPYRPIDVPCPKCEVKTSFSSHMRFNTSEGNLYFWTHQCQSCGALKISDETHPKGVCVGLKEKCECGGQFRRDKNIFCPSCVYRKSEENRKEEKLYATKEEMESIRERHGTEELKQP